MNGYIAFYNGKRIEVYAATLLAARNEAAKLLQVKAKNAYKIAIALAEKNGEQVVNAPQDVAP